MRWVGDTLATEAVHTTYALADHLPVLSVLVPFIAAPLIVLLGIRSIAWPLAFIASAASFGISIALLLQVIAGDAAVLDFGAIAHEATQQIDILVVDELDLVDDEDAGLLFELAGVGVSRRPGLVLLAGHNGYLEIPDWKMIFD